MDSINEEGGSDSEDYDAHDFVESFVSWSKDEDASASLSSASSSTTTSPAVKALRRRSTMFLQQREAKAAAFASAAVGMGRSVRRRQSSMLVAQSRSSLVAALAAASSGTKSAETLVEELRDEVEELADALEEKDEALQLAGAIGQQLLTRQQETTRALAAMTASRDEMEEKVRDLREQLSRVKADRTEVERENVSLMKEVGAATATIADRRASAMNAKRAMGDALRATSNAQRDAAAAAERNLRAEQDGEARGRARSASDAAGETGASAEGVLSDAHGIRRRTPSTSHQRKVLAAAGVDRNARGAIEERRAKRAVSRPRRTARAEEGRDSILARQQFHLSHDVGLRVGNQRVRAAWVDRNAVRHHESRGCAESIVNCAAGALEAGNNHNVGFLTRSQVDADNDVALRVCREPVLLRRTGERYSPERAKHISTAVKGGTWDRRRREDASLARRNWVRKIRGS